MIGSGVVSLAEGVTARDDSLPKRKSDAAILRLDEPLEQPLRESTQ